MSVIANNLRWIRKRQNISQTQFADVFGITRASVGAYEEGRAEPKLELLMKITRHYDLELSNFIENDLNTELDRTIIKDKPEIISIEERPNNNYIQEFIVAKPSPKNKVKNASIKPSEKPKESIKGLKIPFYKSAKNIEFIATSNWPFFVDCDAVFECNPHLERENPIFKDGFIFITSKIEQEGVYKGTFILKDGKRLQLLEEELLWDKTSLDTWKVIYIIESISNFNL